MPLKIKEFKKLEKQTEQNKAAAAKTGLSAEYYHKYGDMAELEPPVQDNFISENLDESTKQLVKDSIVEPDKAANTTGAEFKSSFSIQVPSIASYNNADSVSGNVYTWNLKEDSPTVIKLQYVQYSGFAILFVIALGILLLILLAKRIIKHDSQKRMDNVDNIV